MLKKIYSTAILGLLLACGAIADNGTARHPADTGPASAESAPANNLRLSLAVTEIGRQVISSGGGKGASQNFRLNCSVAQTATGEGASDSYELWLGFWPPFGGTCCNLPGDANNDMMFNVGDAVYIINYVFKGGPPPPCMAEADVNNDCSVNVADAVSMINIIFKGAPLPVCGCAE